MLAHRIHPSRYVESYILRRQNVILDISKTMIVPDRVVPDSISRRRAIVLKKPRFSAENNLIEKGVLLIKFSTTFKFFLKNIDCEKLLQYFQIVLEPSWAGYCLPEIIGWTKFDDNIVIECSELQDYNFIKGLNSNLVPVRFGSSDWVDHRIFFPEKREKKYDVIYISNYNSIKRNHAYLKAVKNIKKPNFKAALVCNSWGECKQNVKTLIDYYGISNKLDLFEALNQKELNELLNQSKINVLLSLKEGSNRSIFESMFTGIPGIVLEENIGVNKHYVNEHTGRLVKSRNLEKEILNLAETHSNFNPRDWVFENISIFATKEKLDTILREEAIKAGFEWTSGTLLKVNSPEANYFEADLAQKMPTAIEICDLFGFGAKNEVEIRSTILEWDNNSNF